MHTCSARLVDCRTCCTRDETCVCVLFFPSNVQTSEKIINQRICRTLIRFPTQRTRNILTLRAHIMSRSVCATVTRKRHAGPALYPSARCIIILYVCNSIFFSSLLSELHIYLSSTCI